MIEQYITVEEALSIAKFQTLAEASHANDIFRADQQHWGAFGACGTVFTAGFVAGKRAERCRYKTTDSGADVLMLQERCHSLIDTITSRPILESIYKILNQLAIK